MKAKEQKVCFVVMGFGKKTDYESGRTLDLDATYEAIIKPAVDAEMLRCIRSDEIAHSGIIDTETFDMLLRADLVIADISTGNVNAVYELGVRHALRPNSTILMKETKGRLYFDLNHINIFQYEHLGEDIGSREATRAKPELQLLISAVLESSKPDSPVYTYLPHLQQPRLNLEQYEKLLDKTETYQENLSDRIQEGNLALRESRFDDAIKAFSEANIMKGNDPFIIQQLTLATYKSEKPSPLSALIESSKIIETLTPNESNDPETLGITGAIYKRLWLLTKDRSLLDNAIKFYGRGFDIRGDYYNGENLALCFDYRSKIQGDKNEALFDRMSARKTREAIIPLLLTLIQSSSFEDRSDKKWIHATLANCAFAIGDNNTGNKHEQLFLSEKPACWEIDTYNTSKAHVIEILRSEAPND